MVREQLQIIFRDVFDDPSLIIQDEMGPGVFPAWDSIETVQIVMSLEQSFGIRLTVDEVAGIKSVGYLVSLINGKTSKSL